MLKVRKYVNLCFAKATRLKTARKEAKMMYKLGGNLASLPHLQFADAKIEKIAVFLCKRY